MVIFLNGTSSAGKTSLALALQEKLPAHYQHIALDQFRDGMSAAYRGLNAPGGTPGEQGLNVVPVNGKKGSVITEVQFGETGRLVLSGMRRAMVSFAEAGNNIIIDDIILNPEFLDDYLHTMSGLTLYFVGVRCPMDVIEQREAERLGRFPGTAESHFDICHSHGSYDVEVDTSRFSPTECADLVIERMQLPPTAFDELRKSRRR